MPETPAGPAYRVETARLVLRCWDPADAPLLHEAIQESLEALRPWMPWAHLEPLARRDRVRLLREWRAKFDLDEDYVYAILDPEEGRVLGGTGLHTRVGRDGREIGFWTRSSEVDRGVATEAAAALTRVAFLVDGMERVHIHCDPGNAATTRIAEKLGFAHEATLRHRDRDVHGAPRDTSVFTLLAHDFAGSPAAAASEGVRAQGADGAALLG